MSQLLHAVASSAAEHPLLAAGLGLGLLSALGGRLASRAAAPCTESVAETTVRWGEHAEEDPKKKMVGRHRHGHVLQIEAVLQSDGSSGVGDVSTQPFRCFSLNVYGPGVPSIAGMFLPLKAGSKFMDCQVTSQGDGTCRLVIGLGASTKKETVLNQLKNFVAADQAFIVELLLSFGQELNAQSVCAVAVSPRKLYDWLSASVQREPKGEAGGASSMLLAPSLPASQCGLQRRPREKTASGVFGRFLLCPVASAAVLWLGLRRGVAESLLWALPPFPGFGALTRGASTRSLLPPMPSSLLQAYDLGALHEVLRREPPGSPAYAAALTTAAELVGRAVSVAELDAVREQLVKALAHRSVAQRVAGFFSFVNIMWLAAICGLTISVGPVVWLVSEPLRKLLKRILAKMAAALKDALVWFAKNVLVPTAVRLHTWGAFEIVGHMAALALYFQALRVNEGRTYVGVSGLVALLGASSYSCFLHRPDIALETLKSEKAEHAVRRVLVPLYPAVLCVPAAVVHQSTLLAFASTHCVLSSLGFCAAAYPFCYCVGWESEDAMARTAAACGLAMAAFVALRAANCNAAALRPFVPAVSVLGGLGHYLALLIRANAHYRTSTWREDRRSHYARNNVHMAVSLASALLAGNLLGMSGLSNTAITFSVLWGLDKAREVADAAKLSAWFLIFGGSLLAYYLALWLHAHPEFVVSLFKALD